MKEPVPQAVVRRPPAATLAVLGLLLLGGVALRIGHWHPGWGSDDTRYLRAATALAHGEFPEGCEECAVRLPFEAWLATLGAEAGVCAAGGLAVFAGTAVLLFLLTRTLVASDRAALAAVLLYMLLPTDIVNTTSILPDQFMTMLVLAACLLYVGAVRAGDLRRQVGFGLAAGLTLGLAVSAKEPAFCFGLAMGVDLVCSGRRVREIARIAAAMAVGVAVAMVIETAVFWLWMGDPLFRIHTSVAVYGGEGRWRDQLTLGKAATYLVEAANSRGEYGLHGLVIGVAALAAIARRRSELRLVLLGAGILLVYLSVGSSSLTTYNLVPQVPRYLLPALVIGCAVAGVELIEAARRMALPRWAWGAAATVFALLSLFAAQMIVPPGRVDTGRWLAEMTAEERARYAVAEDFVGRMPGELAERLAGVGTIKAEAFESAQALTRGLEGRAYAEADLGSFRVDVTVDERLCALGVRYAREDVMGTAWPPYHRWLRFGEQERVIARVYRVER